MTRKITRKRRLYKPEKEEIAAQNRVRERWGLEQLKIKIRKCLRCGAEFESKGNRTCGCIKFARMLDIECVHNGLPK